MTAVEAFQVLESIIKHRHPVRAFCSLDAVHALSVVV